MPECAVELRETGVPPRTIEVAGGVELGREGTDIIVADPNVSRRHLRFTATGGTLTVTDLGSRNGTLVNGVRIAAETALRTGDTVRAGGVELLVLQAGSEEPALVPPPGPRPTLEEMERIESDAAVVRFRTGSVGERYARDVADAARVARRRLSGLGSEPWGVVPTICLSDPFPSADTPGEVIAEGTVVDADHGEIWMVVTAESPPDPLERALALFFGAALPAGAEVEVLLEGYGLHIAGTADTSAELRELDLPSLATASGELRAAMAVAFVRWLIARGNVADFLKMLTTARPGRVEAAAQEIYGQGMASLEEAWRHDLAGGPPDVELRQFVRLVGKYLRPHIAREAEMFVYMVLGLGFTIVFPFAFRRLLDHAIPSGHFSQVVGILTILGVAFVVSLVAGLRRAYLSAVVSSSVVRQVRNEMFGRLQELSHGWFSGHQEGDIMSRLFSDVMLLEQGLSQTVREGAFQLLSLVVSGVVLFVLNPLLAGVVIIGAPLVAIVYKVMANGAQRRSIAVQEQTGNLYSVAAENYAAQNVVKAFGLENREVGRFERAADRLFGKEISLQLFGGLFGLSVNMIVTVLRLIVLGLGSWLILHGHLTVGGLVAVSSLMGEVLSPVTVLTGIGQQVQASTGALVRINDVLGAAPEIADAPDAVPLPPLAHEIHLSGVGFSYTPERRTLDGVDVTIAAGSRVAFVGPTGAGKSSILQLIMRFYDPDEGAVLFDGNDLRHVTVDSLRQQMGIVFQDTFLFDATVSENIALAKPGATDAEIEAASRAAELHDFVMSLPRGYDTLVGERGGRLSGGQRQRMAIARSLLRDPRVLVLDEATSALDARTERLISDTLEKVGEGRTTIAVTHRLTSITGYDRIFVIDEGRVVQEGTHDDLVASDGLYARLWAEQAGGQTTPQAVFDVHAALARVPLFRTLSGEQLATVAASLRDSELPLGGTLHEVEGQLVLVRSGRGNVLVPGVTGQLVAVAELRSGDAFGIAALLGQPIGAVLEAAATMQLVFLDEQSIAALARSLPPLAAEMAGRNEPAAAPTGGTRLSRMTVMPSHAGGPGPAPPVPLADIRRDDRRVPDRATMSRVETDDGRAGDAVLTAIVRTAVQAANASRGWLAIEDQDDLVVVAAFGDDTHGLVLRRFPVGSGTTGYVLTSGQPLALSSVGDDRMGDGIGSVLENPPQTVLSVPCTTSDAVVGALEVVDKEGGARFTFDDVELVTLIAEIAAATLAGAAPALTLPTPAELATDLEHLASTDPVHYATVAIALRGLLAHE